ncbi:DUF2442 domain-containing protein [Hydrogenovibrio halophilus]|uniref:DUF2442 domain-containing protein n=1 Tax=Hydrogenovibrio halophilus TaxID=373391 RepID=UPI000373D7C8|nr:DUF2442 domain-containing protein [Hydrogenovibrio halophilus]
MNTFQINEPTADQVTVTESDLKISLTDGRTLTVPLVWYERLATATPEQLQNFELLGDGEGIHWPLLDEDLSIKGFLMGVQTSTLNQKTA